MNIKRKFGRVLLKPLKSHYLENELACRSLDKLRSDFKSAVCISSTNREQIWQFALDQIDPGQPILYCEFGVASGESMRFFTNKIAHPDSRFFGFDTFEGLPESWGKWKLGSFSTNGQIPNIEDSRLKFIRGLFQHSLPETIEWLKSLSKTRILLIHFDADLYSSTLYLLTYMRHFFEEYYFLCDEFYPDESRAMCDYKRAYCANIEYLAYNLDRSSVFCPINIFGKHKSSSLTKASPSNSAFDI